MGVIKYFLKAWFSFLYFLFEKIEILIYKRKFKPNYQVCKVTRGK